MNVPSALTRGSFPYAYETSPKWECEEGGVMTSMHVDMKVVQMAVHCGATWANNHENQTILSLYAEAMVQYVCVEALHHPGHCVLSKKLCLISKVCKFAKLKQRGGDLKLENFLDLGPACLPSWFVQERKGKHMLGDWQLRSAENSSHWSKHSPTAHWLVMEIDKGNF